MSRWDSSRRSRLSRHARELTAASAYVVLLTVMAVIAPSFFSLENLRDLFVNNAPVLILAVGMTSVILSGEIDISIGSQFAVCSVLAGWLAKGGTPLLLLPFATIGIGAMLGAINGILVAKFRIPAIIVTLATLVIWRDSLRWITQGAWIQELPARFQWFGLGQTMAEILIIGSAVTVLLAVEWGLRSLRAGREIYAVGSNRAAAHLVGVRAARVLFIVFTAMGALTGLAAVLNAVRFSAVPGNLGLGLELKVIAAVVVGGTLITGGRGTVIGTLVGVTLLGTIGTALTFAGINPFWEKAIQGAIILAALLSETALRRWTIPARFDFLRSSHAN